MHIDAAYAGSAFICPEFRPLLNGVEVGSVIFIATVLNLDHFDAVHKFVLLLAQCFSRTRQPVPIGCEIGCEKSPITSVTGTLDAQ